MLSKWLKTKKSERDKMIKNPKFYYLDYIDNFLYQFVFDWLWELSESSLINFRQSWSNLIKNNMTLFILMINVTTCYINIERMVKISRKWKILIISSEIQFD